ncbi:MAG: hypothetical protein FWC59_02530 [Actinomycetia bacterium]|nr:hypothetical protein [Actinomycetes bacterium]
MRLWIARFCVLAVFAVNIYCALVFIVLPDQYLASYELNGPAGRAALMGLGVAFLMWNTTYPPVIYRPERYRLLYVIVLIQQMIGLVGESLILWQLPAETAALAASLQRFILFDAAGLLLLLLGWGLARRRKPKL